MDRRRRQATEKQHPHRGVRAHSALECVSGMGLGNGRQRAGAGVPEEVRFSDRAERSHSPDHAEGGRERDVSYGSVDRISATATRQSRFPGTNESTCRATKECFGNYRRELPAEPQRSGGSRLDACVNRKKPGAEKFNPTKTREKKKRKMNKKNVVNLSLFATLNVATAALTSG